MEGVRKINVLAKGGWMIFPFGQDARIGVVAPSGVVDPVKLEKGMAVLRAAGWDVAVDTAVGMPWATLPGVRPCEGPLCFVWPRRVPTFWWLPAEGTAPCGFWLN